MKEQELSERERAVVHVLIMLRNPIMLVTRPERENALALARQYNITAEELLEVATRRARNA